MARGCVSPGIRLAQWDSVTLRRTPRSFFVVPRGHRTEAILADGLQGTSVALVETGHRCQSLISRFDTRHAGESICVLSFERTYMVA